MTTPAPDVAQVAELLRRQPICTSCAAAKLALSLERLFTAIEGLSKTIALNQGLGRCPICERRQWVLSLAT